MSDKEKHDESIRRKIEEALALDDAPETENIAHEEMVRRWQDKNALLRKLLERRWRIENHDAIAAYNTRIEQDGVFGSRKKKF